MDTPSPFDIDLGRILERLRQAHRRKRPDYRQRMDDLARLADTVKRHADELVRAVSGDFGRRSRHVTQSADLMTTLGEIRHLRKHLRRWMRPRRAPVNAAFLPARGELLPQPLGVVGIMAPWNYPIQLLLIPLADAIAAGNHVMAKPSEFAPRTAEVLAKVVSESFPPDRVILVQGDAELGAAFSRLRFDHLLFTGSTAVGRKVMAAAAPNLTPVTLELGGKSPALVAPGYDLRHAAARIAVGKCFNAGQTCVAPDYVLVPRGDRDTFARLLLAELRRLYPGLAGNPDYTAIVNARQAARLRDMLEEARDHGVTVLQYRPEQEAPPPGIELLPPTLLLDPPDHLQVMREEIFGPLLPLKSYDSHEEAIAYILERERPLAFYPFDRDRRRLQRSLEAVVAGSVCVNDTLIQFGQDELPIGGVGASGMGRYHGEAGFLTFSHMQPVMRQSRLNGVGLFDPPYGRVADFLLRLLMR